MKKTLALAVVALLSLPSFARAQGAAPEMFGVREVILQYTRFVNAKASDTCGLSRDTLEALMLKALSVGGTPVYSVSEAKPPIMGIARIDLVPEVSSYTDENLNCVSWVSLSAESRVNAVVQPVTTLRSITAVYWRQRTMAASSQSTHAQNVGETLRKMAQQFSQQYRLDQPPDVQQKIMQQIQQMPVQPVVPQTDYKDLPTIKYSR
jgi:hypothetical protein